MYDVTYWKGVCKAISDGLKENNSATLVKDIENELENLESAANDLACSAYFAASQPVVCAERLCKALEVCDGRRFSFSFLALGVHPEESCPVWIN